MHINHVPKCMSFHNASGLITGRACFNNFMYMYKTKKHKRNKTKQKTARNLK